MDWEYDLFFWKALFRWHWCTWTPSGKKQRGQEEIKWRVVSLFSSILKCLPQFFFDIFKYVIIATATTVVTCSSHWEYKGGCQGWVPALWFSRRLGCRQCLLAHQISTARFMSVCMKESWWELMLKERRRARQGEVKHRLQEFVEACELQTITSLNIN